MIALSTVTGAFLVGGIVPARHASAPTGPRPAHVAIPYADCPLDAPLTIATCQIRVNAIPVTIRIDRRNAGSAPRQTGFSRSQMCSCAHRRQTAQHDASFATTASAGPSKGLRLQLGDDQSNTRPTRQPRAAIGQSVTWQERQSHVDAVPPFPAHGAWCERVQSGDRKVRDNAARPYRHRPVICPAQFAEFNRLIGQAAIKSGLPGNVPDGRTFGNREHRRFRNRVRKRYYLARVNAHPATADMRTSRRRGPSHALISETCWSQGTSRLQPWAPGHPCGDICTNVEIEAEVGGSRRRYSRYYAS